MKKILSVMLFVSVVVASSAKEYVVQKGEYLGKIARENNTTINAVAQKNKIKNADMIYAGQKLYLPEGKNKVNVLNALSIKDAYYDEFVMALEEKAEMMDGGIRFLVNQAEPTELMFVGRARSQYGLEKLSGKLTEGKLAELEGMAMASEPMVVGLNPIFSTNGEYLRTPSRRKSPYIVTYMFTVESMKRSEVIDRVRTYIYRTRKEKANLLADFYSIDGSENTFFIHEEFKAEKDYMDVHLGKSYAMNLETYLNGVLDNDYEAEAYVFEEIK